MMNLERCILIELEGVFPQMLRDETLFAALQLSPGSVTKAAMDLALSALQRKDQVIGIPSDDGTRWKIAAQGRARLAER